MLVLDSGACAFFGNLGIDIFLSTFWGGNLDVLDIIHVKGWSHLSLSLILDWIELFALELGFYL